MYLKTSSDADSNEIEPFRLMVYLGYKTMTVLLFKPDFEFTFAFLNGLQ